MSALIIRRPDEKHERLKRLAKARGVSVTVGERVKVLPKERVQVVAGKRTRYMVPKPPDQVSADEGMIRYPIA